MYKPLNDLKSAFSKVAQQYDAQRLQLIPCLTEFYQSGLLADSLFRPPTEILDLGCGTGLFSGFAALRYPEAAFLLVDVSEDMISQAKKRLSSIQKIRFICADILELNISGTFDLVISGLAIHHLEDSQKQELFQRIYGWLKPGGRFINADQVLGDSGFTEQVYTRIWKKQVEASGLSRAELDQAYSRMTFDKMAAASDQLDWLKSAGFSHSGVIYQSFNFVVFLAQKATEEGFSG